MEELFHDVGEIYLNQLVHRSMVQIGECWPSGRIKTCRVHDIMRDMRLRKCEEATFLDYINCSGSDMISPFTVEMRKLRRCALDVEAGDFFYTL